MPAVRAFVGHSFRKEDEAVVNTILKCLDRIKDLRADFDWEHALDPEPRPIDAKVLTLFKDKTLFIGICTRAERAIAERDLSRCLGRRWAMEEAFEWKTSDWVVQEIGLAVGRGMDVILLVESGIRVPGALQGNLERIPFDRAAPERCFDALLGMVATLTGKAPHTVPMADEVSQAETVAAPEVQEEADEAVWREPKSDWDMVMYRVAYRLATRSKDEATRQKIKDAFVRSSLAEVEYNRAAWRAQAELIDLTTGNGGSVAALVNMATDAPDNAVVADCVASAYDLFGDPETSSIWYERASASESLPAHKVRRLAHSLLASLRAGNEARTADLERRMLEIGQGSSEATVELLRAQIDLAEERKESEYAIACMEKLLTLQVDDYEMRFKLAYKYGDTDHPEMAAYHYAKLPAGTRSRAAWNNLGVVYSGLGLPVKAMEAFRRAESLGETLAMANIAERLMSAGFLSEATELLSAASAMPNHNRLVDSHFADAKALPDQEDEKHRDLSAASKRVSDFYSEFGGAYLAPLRCELSGDWEGPLGRIVVHVSRDRFTASAEAPYSALALSLSIPTTGLMASAASKPPPKRTNEYSGLIRGRTAICTRKRAGSPGMTNLLSDSEEAGILMKISDDCTEIHLLHSFAARKPDVVVWRRRSGQQSA